MDSLFHVKDYRMALKLQQKQLKAALGMSYSIGEFADGIRVQRTYLSKVLNGAADLSDDQMFLALKFLKFNDVESHYLKLLHALQRTSLAERKKELETQLEDFRQNHLRADHHMVTKNIQDEEVSSKNLQKYYLDPYIQLTHMFLTVERFRKEPSKIAVSLNLSDTRWKQILETLIEMEIIVVENEQISVKQEHLMLSKDSTLLAPYHMLAKANALTRMQTLQANQKNSLSMVFTCSKETKDEARTLLIDFLKNLEKLILNDKAASEVLQLSVDLFPWS